MLELKNRLFTIATCCTSTLAALQGTSRVRSAPIAKLLRVAPLVPQDSAQLTAKCLHNRLRLSRICAAFRASW